MPIVIQGDEFFRNATLNALALICPCYSFPSTDNPVNGATHVTFQDFQVGPDCCCYCGRRAGCNLVADLANSTGTTQIQVSAWSNTFANGIVNWANLRATGPLNSRGDFLRPPSVALARALVEALDHQNGTVATGDTAGIPNDKLNAVRGENQIRLEMGEPIRVRWRGIVVPNPTRRYLDNSARLGDCNCGWLARFACWFRRVFGNG